LLERAQEIIGETAVQGLINPFDSDINYVTTINDNKENNVIEDILQEDKNNESNQNDVFSVNCVFSIKKYGKV